MKLQMVQVSEVASISRAVPIYKPFDPFPLPSWLATYTRGVVCIVLSTLSANRNKSIECFLQYDQLWVVMKDLRR